MANMFGAGFQQGFAQQMDALTRLKLARDEQVAREERAKEQLKLQQQQLKGAEATRLLAEQRIMQEGQLAQQKLLMQMREFQQKQQGQQAIQEAMQPEGAAPTGRPIVQNPDGTVSTERTITIEDERINGGKPTNIPTMFQGREVAPEEAIERIAQAGGIDPETRQPLPGFESIEAAEAAARARSESLGQTLQPMTVQGQRAGPTREEDLGQLQVWEAREQQLGKQIKRLLPFTVSEEGSRVVTRLQAEQTNVRQNIQSIRGRLSPGTSEIEQILGKSIAHASDKEIAAARQQLLRERESLASRQGERAAERTAAGQIRAAEIQAEQRQREVILPSGEERKRLADISIGLSNIDALEGQLENPQVQQVLGPLFSENPQAALKRKLGEGFEQAMTPDQRQFLVELGAMTAETRNAIFGAALTPSEIATARTFLPEEGDSPARVKAKLKGMKSWMQRKEAGMLRSWEQLGVRTERKGAPKAPETSTAPSAAPAMPAQPLPPNLFENPAVRALKPGEELTLPDGTIIRKKK